MKTLKATLGLLLAPVLVLLAETAATLLPCQRNSEARRQVYEAIRQDLRTLARQ